MRAPDPVPPTRFGRRELLSLGVGAFVLAALPAALRSRERAWRRRIPVMGTLGEIVVVHADGRVANAAIDAAADALRHVEDLMTRYRPTSEIGRANLAAAREAVAVSGPTATVLAEALRLAQATEGRFDPCLGRAVQLWDVEHRHEPPPAADVLPLAHRSLYRTLDLDSGRQGARVVFRDADVDLDLGGIAKGYGVDRAADALRRCGVERGFVNVGGDLYALGASEDGDPWRVGIRDAQDPARFAGEIEVADEAVATSGDYERCFVHAGRRYHHILDAATAAPREVRLHSLTVAAPDCMTADGAATAAFGLDPDAAAALLERAAPAARVIRAL
jgi:thiamine biosynthesis lipoprotein